MGKRIVKPPARYSPTWSGAGARVQKAPTPVNVNVFGKKVNVRRSTRQRSTPDTFGTFATDAELRDADPYLMEIMRDDPATGRPGAPASLWDQVYKKLGWKNVKPGKLTDTRIAHTAQCREPTCLAASRTINLNAQFQELDAVATPHGALRRPPICHITPWAALKAYLDYVELTYTVVHRAGFVKKYCWDAPNVQPGHNQCNATGVHTTAATVTAQQLAAAKIIYDTVRVGWAHLGLEVFEA